MSRFAPLLVCATVLFCALPAPASDLRFSAYLTQTYSRADADELDLFGLDKRGSLQNTLYALKIDMFMADRLSLHTEISDDPMATDATTSLEPRISLAEGRLGLTDNLTLKAGISKMPIGLYNEYRNVGVAYLTTILPSMYINTAGILVENYRGIGAVYTRYLGDVELIVDLYYGEAQMYSITDEEGLLATDKLNLETGEFSPYRLRDLYGGRLYISGLLPGLELGWGAFAGTEYRDEPGAPDVTWNSWIASLQWHWSVLRLTGEWTRQNLDEGGESFFVIIGLDLFDQLDPFVMFDQFYSDQDHRRGAWGNPLAGEFGVFFRDAVIGCRWRPYPALTLKAEWHEFKSNVANTAVLEGRRSVDNYDHIWSISATVSYF